MHNAKIAEQLKTSLKIHSYWTPIMTTICNPKISTMIKHNKLPSNLDPSSLIKILTRSLSHKDPSIWAVESGISDSLVMDSDMAEENKFGKIIPCTKAIGSRIGLMEGADSFMQMAMSMKASGKMTKLMEKEFTQKTMAQVIQVNGIRTSSTDLEFKNGQTAHPTKGNAFFKGR